MPKASTDDFKRALENKRKELLRVSSDREEILIQHAADEFDRLQQQQNREIAIRNLDREARLLRNVQAALARFDQEIFGVCLRCDEEIPEKRLKAVPWASYCVDCQERIDQQQATQFSGIHEGDRRLSGLDNYIQAVKVS